MTEWREFRLRGVYSCSNGFIPFRTLFIPIQLLFIPFQTLFIPFRPINDKKTVPKLLGDSLFGVMVLSGVKNRYLYT